MLVAISETYIDVIMEGDAEVPGLGVRVDSNLVYLLVSLALERPEACRLPFTSKPKDVRWLDW